MNSASNKLYPELMTSISASTFTGSYQLVKTTGNIIRAIKFINDTSVPVTLSWDGTNDHDFYPTLSQFVLDVATNRETSFDCYIPSGQPLYVKGAAGTGSFYIVSWYAKD